MSTTRFTNGLLKVEENKISFNYFQGYVDDVNTISRDNIGHVELHEMRMLPKSEMNYCFRLALIGIVIMIIGTIAAIAKDVNFLLYIGFVTLAFSVILLFSYMWLDNILGIRFASSILISIWGEDVTRVVVQNKFGGNNMIFVVSKDEANKLPDIEKLAIEKIDKVSEPRFSANAASISDLEKLAELKDKGIITESEFELKKKSILGF